MLKHKPETSLNPKLKLMQRQRKARAPPRFIGLAMNGETATVEQSQDIAGIQTLVLLDEELHQSDRLYKGENNGKRKT